MSKFAIGAQVSFTHENTIVLGYILTRFTSNIEMEISGKTFFQEASPHYPAYLIELEDGEYIIKPENELKQNT